MVDTFCNFYTHCIRFVFDSLIPCYYKPHKIGILDKNWLYFGCTLFFREIFDGFSV